MTTEEEEGTMSTVQARTRANNKWNAKTYENVTFRIKLDGTDGITKEMISKAAEASGESLNQFIIKALRERMDRMK